MKQVQQDGLKYLINDKEERAEIVSFYGYIKRSFLIPRSIKCWSHEYIVRSISKKSLKFSWNIKSIQFPTDSELQTIEEEAFSSSIESIFIPASMIDLIEGWCEYTNKLTTVKVDPKKSIIFISWRQNDHL